MNNPIHEEGMEDILSGQGIKASPEQIKNIVEEFLGGLSVENETMVEPITYEKPFCNSCKIKDGEIQRILTEYNGLRRSLHYANE